MAPQKLPLTSPAYASRNEEERIIQAIVIADSFNERFMPITLDKPRCLLPLVNIPIIEYTLEFLAVSGILEVILFCRAHADQIKDYINRSRWSRPSSTLTIQVIMSPECSSLGDALRDIDAKGFITGDFVLCSGDVVSNMNISAALSRHQQRRKADKNVIMTMLLKECDPLHRTREHCEGAMFVLDGAETVSYHPVLSERLDSRHHIPWEGVLEKRRCLQIRYDLMDCEIDICAQNVLALFTENFDYMDIRKDFVRGILTSDLLGHKIMTEIIQGGSGYAARVRNSRLYDAISRDIIARWTFPIVPESDLMDEQSMKVSRGLIYTADGVLLSRTCTIGKKTVLGSGVSVGEGSRVIMSVMGRNVQIGANCTIEGAYLWDGVVVESNCTLRSCIVADRALIKVGTTVSPGCLITSDVVLGPRIVLPPNTRVAKWSDRLEAALESLSLTSFDEPLNQDILEVQSDINLGTEADGVIWEINSGAIDSDGNQMKDSDGDAARDVRATEQEQAFTIASSSSYIIPEMVPLVSTSSSSGSSSDVDNEAECNDGDALGREEKSGRATSSSSSSSSSSSLDNTEKGNFGREAMEMARNSITCNHSVDNAALELNSLKFACNASFSDCRIAVMKALLAISYSPASGQPSDILQITGIWGQWAALLQRFIFSESDMLETLGRLNAICRPHPLAFQYIVPVLYKHDVLDGETITQWHYKHTEDKQLASFVEWLEASDDSDDLDE